MKTRLLPQWARLVPAVCLVAALLIATFAPPAGAAGLLIADNGFGGVLEIKEQAVRATINNGVAVTEVEQVFLNTEDRVVEALYTFPVPKGASVSNFSMWINGKEMTGEVVEKQRARQIYESYKQTRRDPGLLEQVDYRRFEMRVFPIPAKAEQRVKLTYAQELDYDHDTATYVYPLATVATANADQRTRGRFGFSLEAKSEVPISVMKSPSHGDEFAVVKHADNYWQASLETREGDLNRDLVIVYQMERARTGVDLIASKTQGEDGYFLLTLTAGKELEAAGSGSDYVFVLDVSGSMANDGKLTMSRNSVERFVAALDDSDNVELITFNISAQTLFGSLKPATAEAKTQAEEFLRAQRAVGGTVLRPAIEGAYRYRQADRPLNVVILSDGMTEPAGTGAIDRLDQSASGGRHRVLRGSRQRSQSAAVDPVGRSGRRTGRLHFRRRRFRAAGPGLPPQADPPGGKAGQADVRRWGRVRSGAAGAAQSLLRSAHPAVRPLPSERADRTEDSGRGAGQPHRPDRDSGPARQGRHESADRADVGRPSCPAADGRQPSQRHDVPSGRNRAAV